MSSSQEDCIFCNKTNCKVISTTKYFFIIRDTAYPVTKHHTLIITNRHVADFFELTKEEMTEALDDLKAFDERQSKCFPGTSRKYNSGWHQALDLKNMVDVSIAATLAALTREESRGGHTRDDFPGEIEEWGKIVNIVYMENDEIKIRQEPVEEMRSDLKDAIKEVKTMIAERAAEAGGED